MSSPSEPQKPGEGRDPLEQHERASGAPFVPSSGAPATHTGRPAQHSGAYVPAQARWIMCPHRVSAAGVTRQQCTFSSQLREPVADHLASVHGYQKAAIGFYLNNPWFADELRKEWVARTAGLRGFNPLASVTQETDADDEFCDHPNGYGVNGCPCGATAPDDDERSFRNLVTGEDERAVRCPATIDCANGVWPISKIRRHLQVEHGWTGDNFEDWAERVNLSGLPTVPQSVLDEMRAANARAEANAARFLSPDVSTEQIMAEHDLFAPAAENDIIDSITQWWLDRAAEEAKSVVPKAVEYGSNSLMQMGRKLAQLKGREVSDEEALELGCWFNAVQKVERWTDSVMRGERPSDDTLYDIGVYLKMAQRIRDTGSWPGV